MINWTGEKIGNYQLLRPIGHGGFADVYLGQHTYLETYAAIKILQSRLAQNDLAVFLTEARTIANLMHPHIVRVLEFGEEGQTPYLVMDYCPNGSLRQRHPKGSHVSLPECVAYVKQVASALQYAHDCKIIHRDVKPENILIGQNGSLLLGDFGIAIVSQSSRYSNQQDLGGTIAYAAPEQLQGKATFASDQYALGVLVYEWLTGNLPFKGSFSEIASQHLVAPLPSLNAQTPGLPPTVEQVLQKALAKDPRQRFESVQSFANALEQTANGTFSGTATLLRPQKQENIATYISQPQYPPTIEASLPPPPPNTTMNNSWNTPPVNTAFQPTPSFARLQNGPPRKSKTGIIITGLVILVLLLGGLSTWALTRPSLTPSTGGNTHTANSASSGTTQAGPPLSQPPTSTPVSNAPVADGTINKNLRLSCTCDDPIALTINTITVDPNKGNMTWNLSFNNVGGENYQIYLLDFHITSTINGQQQTYNASGAVMDGGQSPMGVLTKGIDPGQTVETPVIFSFVPLKNIQYTLTTQILNNGNTYVSISFDPATLTFS